MTNPFVEKLGRHVSLSDEEMRALSLATAIARDFGPRKDIIREGDRPGPTFVILKGWACRYKVLPNGGRQLTAFLMPGDACDLYVGLLAEMDHGIQAVNQCRVATIAREEMEALLGRYPRIARAMYISQLVDAGTLRAWIVSMGRRSSLERVAHLMCELYLRAQSIGLVEHSEFALPLTQIVLADALGLTPVHLNRVVKELRVKGVMSLKRGHLLIIDPTKLAQIAGFDENYLHRVGRLSLRDAE